VTDVTDVRRRKPRQPDALIGAEAQAIRAPEAALAFT